MKRRIRPVADPRDEAVLHRVEMAILNMVPKVGVVADHVLPVAALPDPGLALGGS